MKTFDSLLFRFLSFKKDCHLHFRNCDYVYSKKMKMKVKIENHLDERVSKVEGITDYCEFSINDGGIVSSTFQNRKQEDLLKLSSNNPLPTDNGTSRQQAPERDRILDSYSSLFCPYFLSLVFFSC